MENAKHDTAAVPFDRDQPLAAQLSAVRALSRERKTEGHTVSGVVVPPEICVHELRRLRVPSATVAKLADIPEELALKLMTARLPENMAFGIGAPPKRESCEFADAWAFAERSLSAERVASLQRVLLVLSHTDGIGFSDESLRDALKLLSGDGFPTEMVAAYTGISAENLANFVSGGNFTADERFRFAAFYRWITLVLSDNPVMGLYRQPENVAIFTE
ncbi:MAG: hypothetical protein LBN02_03460 [Oscillospiraceae bacterium]|jgi:hypothetical protein|nr:hypothetical protein [Oscillospiraceae bacterium]